MKILFVAGAVLFVASQCICRAYAIELCEPQDYYNLVGSTKCTLGDNKAAGTSDSRELMFGILKNYPFENKDKFIQLLQRKTELVDTYIAQHQSKGETDNVKVNVSMLEQAKRNLSEQLTKVRAATPDNWVSVRDEARAILEDTAQRLRDVE